MPLQLESGANLARHVAELAACFKEHGRQDPPQVTLFNPEGAMGGKRDLATFISRLPSPEEVVYLGSIGVRRVIFGVPTHDSGLLQDSLDTLAKLRSSAVFSSELR